MNQYRVTKYDPALRNADGSFRGADWTSIFDFIGTHRKRDINISAYLSAEAKYVEAVLSCMNAACLTTLVISDLQVNDAYDFSGIDKRLFIPTEIFTDGQRLSERKVETIVRAALREDLWCRLNGDKGFFVHFGNDYYMYIGLPNEVELPILPQGIFAERMESPYSDLESE